VGTAQISTDPFATAVTGQHATEVEPDTFGYGNTVVSAFQVGRIYDGGGTDIGWATNSGGTWQHGLLPGITSNDPVPGPYARATDASVAYDAAHGVWMIQTLGLTVSGSQVVGAAVLVSQSADGVNWSAPVAVSVAGSSANYDKNWIVCDNTASSPYYGHCYSEFDNNGQGDLLLMSTSTDGGSTWSVPVSPAGRPSGLGGQPLVQPSGTVIVPASNGYENAIIAFTSTDGGATWGSAVTISSVSIHTVAGGIRSGPLPTAEMDGGGTVYVAWQDCRFEPSCAANDIVFSTSTDGSTWSAIHRIPIDAVGSGIDHFIPGIAVNPATSGSSAQIGLAYYYYPVASCSSSTCRLEVGYVSSSNGGQSWSAPTQLAGSAGSATGLGPMTLSWLPTTSQGTMVGDYISTSFTGTTAVPVFAVAQAPSGGVFNQSMYAAAFSAAGGSVQATQSAARTGTSLPIEAADKAARDKNAALKER
jgi:hypothetical protein